MTLTPDNTPAPALELLARYLRGDVTPDERLQVESWLAGDPTRATELEDLRQILLAADARPAWDLDRVWSGIDQRFRSPAVEPTPHRAPRPIPRLMLSSPRWSLPARAAAAAIFVVAVGAGTVVLGRHAEPSAPPPPTVIATTRGQRLGLRLPDSTQVVLAPESRLELSPDFGRATRDVRLAGEAAFTVVHDSTRPFAVETPITTVRDLGTRFIVRAYGADSTTDVVVADGLVAVGDGDSLVVARGELARVNAGGRVDVTRGVPLDRYFAWTDGRLVFENTPLHEVAARLERWYDIDVRVAPRVANRRVTASFQAESPAEILKLVAGLTGLEVVSEGRTYTVRPRQ